MTVEPSLQHSVAARDGFHQERERVSQCAATGACPSIVALPHDNEIVRWDDQGRLPTRTRHVVRLARYWERAGAVDPEEPAVDRPSVCLARRAPPCSRSPRTRRGGAVPPSRLRPADTGCPDAPNRAPARARSPATGSFRTGRSRAPCLGCRSCRTARAVGTTGIPRRVLQRRGGRDS